MTTQQQVILELREMRELGIGSTRRLNQGIRYAQDNEAIVEEYRENGMRISEIADLVCDLASI